MRFAAHLPHEGFLGPPSFNKQQNPRNLIMEGLCRVFNITTYPACQNVKQKYIPPIQFDYCGAKQAAPDHVKQKVVYDWLIRVQIVMQHTLVTLTEE